MVDVKQIKALREKTGVSVTICRQALEAAKGNETEAFEWLKNSGEQLAKKKSSRSLGAGVVAAYIHNNNTLGALLELHTETDFVANNAAFRLLADDLAMQVVATAPETVAELLKQPFIKNPEQAVADLLKESIQKFGERIEIVRFSRFNLAGD